MAGEMSSDNTEELLLDKPHRNYTITTSIFGPGDTRSRDLPLIPSMMTPLAIIAVYLFLTTRVGRFVTQPLPPMEFLRWPIVVYNFVLVLFNAYITFMLYNSTRQLQYKWSCEPVTYRTDHYSMQIVWGLYMYYMSKIIELADTLFLVLRKKWRQLSILHRYHHASMILITWLAVYGYAAGNTAQAAMVNAFIHVLMYTYYGLAALSSLKKDWPLRQPLHAMKKYMTLLQLAQFALGLVFAVIQLKKRCAWHPLILFGFVGYLSSMVALFSNFYYRAYIKEQLRRASAAILYTASMNTRQQKSCIEAAIANKVKTSKKPANGVASKVTSNGSTDVATSNGHHHANGKKLN